MESSGFNCDSCDDSIPVGGDVIAIYIPKGLIRRTSKFSNIYHTECYRSIAGDEHTPNKSPVNPNGSIPRPFCNECNHWMDTKERNVSIVRYLLNETWESYYHVECYESLAGENFLKYDRVNA